MRPKPAKAPSTYERYQRFTSALLERNPRRIGNDYICPAHDDDNPSLGVNLDNGRVLVKCMAGCETEDVLAALGFRWSDLFGNGDASDSDAEPPQPLPTSKEIKTWFENLREDRKRLEYWTKTRKIRRKILDRYQVGFDPYRRHPDGGSHGAYTFPYRDRDGRLLNVKTRWNARGQQKKEFRLVKGQPTDFVWPLDQLHRKWVVICEGEPEALRLISLGLPAVTAIKGAAGGVKAIKQSAHLFEDMYVVVSCHADEAGRKNAKRVAEVVTEWAERVVIFEPFPGEDSHKDLCDWFERPENTVEKFKAEIKRLPSSRNQRKPWTSLFDPDTLPKRHEIFDENGKFIPPRLGRAAESIGHLRVGADRNLWRYEAGMYRNDGDEWLGGFVRATLGDDFRDFRHREVRAWCRNNFESKLPTQPSSDYINVANGILYWKEDPPRLVSHSPDIPSITQIPVAWVPDAECPETLNLYREILPEDCLDFIFEWLGYLLIPTSRYQRALMLLGPRDTGKSTILRGMEGLLGRLAVSHHGLHSICDDRFTAADLYGRLANISADLDAKLVHNSGKFKMIVSGDRISVERKYGQPFSFRPFTRLAFSANEAIGATEQSSAYYKRWLILPMTNQIPESEQDPNLEDFLLSPTELEGVLYRSVMGARRLFKRGRFKEPKSMRDAHARFRFSTDTVAGFCKERTRLAEGSSVRLKNLFDAYSKWCQQNNRHPLVGRERFKERFLDLYRSVSTGSKDGYPVFRGVRLRPRNHVEFD